MSCNASAGKHPHFPIAESGRFKSPHEFGTGWRCGKTLPSQFRRTVILPITKNKAVARRVEGKAEEMKGQAKQSIKTKRYVTQDNENEQRTEPF